MLGLYYSGSIISYHVFSTSLQFGTHDEHQEFGARQSYEDDIQQNRGVQHSKLTFILETVSKSLLLSPVCLHLHYFTARIRPLWQVEILTITVLRIR